MNAPTPKEVEIVLRTIYASAHKAPDNTFAVYEARKGIQSQDISVRKTFLLVDREGQAFVYALVDSDGGKEFEVRGWHVTTISHNAPLADILSNWQIGSVESFGGEQFLLTNIDGGVAPNYTQRSRTQVLGNPQQQDNNDNPEDFCQPGGQHKADKRHLEEAEIRRMSNSSHVSARSINVKKLPNITSVSDKNWEQVNNTKVILEQIEASRIKRPSTTTSDGAVPLTQTAKEQEMSANERFHPISRASHNEYQGETDQETTNKDSSKSKNDNPKSEKGSYKSKIDTAETIRKAASVAIAAPIVAAALVSETFIYLFTRKKS